MNSGHQCPIFSFDFKNTKKHPGADRLSIWTVPQTDYQYCLYTEAWVNYSNLVMWCPPESLVDIRRPEFSFLVAEKLYDVFSNPSKTGPYARIKAKRLRGVDSYGICVPIKGDFKDGDDGAEAFDVLHYEPVVLDKAARAETEAAPPGVYHQYGLEKLMQCGRKVFVEGESVSVSLKIHGENSRVAWAAGKLNVSSHYNWKREFTQSPCLTVEDLIAKGVGPDKAAAIYEAKVTNHVAQRSYWYTALDGLDGLHKFVRDHPMWCVYGENYGGVNGFAYDSGGKRKFRAFDISDADGVYVSSDRFYHICDTYAIPTTPVLSYDDPFNFEKLVETANNDLFPEFHRGGIVEGVVVWALNERYGGRCVRAKHKIISMAYAEK